MNELRTLGLGTPGDMRADLNALVLEGTKTATAGLLAEYEREAEELESVGERLALVDDDGAPVGVVEVTAGSGRIKVPTSTTTPRLSVSTSC
jgi:uncharacterized protein YhfF